MARAKILLVDDRAENLVALESLLKGGQVEILKARSGREALELVLLHDFALAMVDVQMPEMSGFELAELMRGAERSKTVPIIFVTAANRDQSCTFQGYETGAVDVLYKPLDPVIVRSKVSVFIELDAQKRLLTTQLEELRRSEEHKSRIAAENALLFQKAQEAIRLRDDFLSIASHELKTPITSLKLQLQMMQRNIHQAGFQNVPEDRVRRMLQTAHRQIGVLTSLVDDLLDVARISNGKLTVEPSEVNLAEVVRKVADQFCEQLELARCPLEIRADDSVVGYWDESRIEQVVVNLLSNAAKYGAGERIIVSVESDGRERARLSVADRGMGIPLENQSRIFERFERAIGSSSISGLGLGLYIVKQILQAHGGEIRVQSEPGRGSTFTVELPLRPAMTEIRHSIGARL